MTRAQIAALAAVLLLAAGVRFHALGRQPLWLDEQGQLSISQPASLLEFWSETRRGGPIGRLSYVDTWTALRAGAHTRAGFRVPAALWGMAAVLLAFVLGRRWFSVSTGLFAAALMSVHALHVQYSREARGYALLVSATLLFAWLLDRLVENFSPGRAAALVLAAVLGTQIHPVFLAPMTAMSAVALAWFYFERPARTGAKAATIAGAGMLSALVFKLTPSDLPLMILNVPVREHSLSYHLIDIHKSLVGGYWGVLSYAMFLFVCIGAWIGLREKTTRRATLLACAAALTASAPILFNYLTANWVVSRYSIYALPFYMLLAACGIAWCVERITQKAWAACATAALLPLILLGAMTVHGRSIYDLEQDKVKQVDPRLPNLPQ